jgi:hypothetical protein
MAATVGSLAVVAVLGPVAQAQAASPSPTPVKPPAAATATNVTTFGIQPVGLGRIDQRGYFLYSGTPGAHIADHAAVLNYSFKPIRLRVNVADALNTPTGGFALTPDTQKPTGVGAWITIPPKYATVTVPARTATKPGEVDVPLSVIIPTSADPGDHVGGITVSLDSLATAPTGQKYKLVQRVGSRVFVRVVGPLRPALAVSNVGLTFHYAKNPFGDGTATVTYSVRNTGNVALGGAQTLKVAGLFGASAIAQKLPQIPLLLPGSAVQLSVVVPGVRPEIRETATVTVVALSVPGSEIPPAGPWSGSASTWAIPLWLVLLVLLLVVLGLTELYWRRRRLRPGPAAEGPDSADSDDPPPAPTQDRTPQGVSP